MRLRTILLGIASLLLVTLLFYACHKEWQTNPSSAETSLTINEAKQFFETNVLTKNNNVTNGRHSFSRRFLQKQNNWTKAFVKQLSIGKVVVAPLQFPTELYMYREDGKIHLPISDLSYMLFYKDSLHKIHAEVVTYLPDNVYFQDTLKNKKFTGVVMVEDWQGNFIKGFKYDSNEIKPIISSEEIRNNSTMREGNTLGQSMREGGKSTVGPVMLEALPAPVTCTATDWYTCVSDDGGSTFDCHYDYTEYDCSGGGGGGDGSGGGSPTGGDYGSLPPKPIGGGGGGYSPISTLNPPPPVDSIYYDALAAYPCAEGAVRSAENLNNNISALIQSIFGESVKYNVHYGVDNSLEGTMKDGQTTMNAHYADKTYSSITRLDININFRPSFLKNATQLAIVATALHEGIHAYYDYKEATAITPAQKTSFNNEFIFLEPFDPQNQVSSAELAQHDQMVTDFINELASALEEYYPISETRYQQLMEYYPSSHLTIEDFYKALAWGGLEGTYGWYMFSQENPALAETYTTIQDAEDFGTNICIANDEKCN